MQERHNFIAYALELCLSCTNPSICRHWFWRPAPGTDLNDTILHLIYMSLDHNGLTLPWTLFNPIGLCLYYTMNSTGIILWDFEFQSIFSLQAVRRVPCPSSDIVDMCFFWTLEEIKCLCENVTCFLGIDVQILNYIFLFFFRYVWSIITFVSILFWLIWTILNFL